MARKLSTVWTESSGPPVSTTAASSGASRPTTTSARSAGATRPSARDSTVAPTLAPQPPHRMASAEMSAMAAASATGFFARDAAAMSGSSLNLRMKRRSIQSLSRHTQCPPKLTPLRAPTAYLSPVVTR